MRIPILLWRKNCRTEWSRKEESPRGAGLDWLQLIQAGVRMFHTTKPAKMKAFLKTME
jgi:hypothetical protein